MRARPDLRRRLRRPVISVGNLAVGGRGKTPTAATIARLLIEMGETPAVLSRGYGRREADDGVVVVRDPGGIRADVARSGDEPFMLARQLPGASVLVSADRYLAGCLAEHHFGATVHVLDDGFQHLAARTRHRHRPGRPRRHRAAADAAIRPPARAAGHARCRRRHRRRGRRGAARWRAAATCRSSAPSATSDDPTIERRGPLLACAGIAAPQAFFEDLRELGPRRPPHDRLPRPPHLLPPRRSPDLRATPRPPGRSGC